MIPRLKPFLGMDEILSLFSRMPNAVEQFETEFAKAAGVKHAVAYPYGRSALWAFFKALELENIEVVQPAYTCVVVSHATVLSGNTPRFIDIRRSDYNADLDQVAASINENTRAVIATHLFGYPLDVDSLAAIVSRAEERFGHKIWIIQDCAHSFGARWHGKLVSQSGDASLYGLNISKMITSIFGGMMTTEDDNLADRLRKWRDENFTQAGIVKSLARSLYLLAVYPVFNPSLYGMVYWLQEETSLLNKLTKAYHLDEIIRLPPDFQDAMLNVEARVGLAQLRKYEAILSARCENARFYENRLGEIEGFELPPLMDGATYSHYVIRVKNRQRVMKEMARRGVQVGQLIEYSIPHMDSYRKYASRYSFQNSLLCSQTTINLPIYPGLSEMQLQKISNALIETMRIVN
jgi:perosamine synthetase